MHLCVCTCVHICMYVHICIWACACDCRYPRRPKACGLLELELWASSSEPWDIVAEYHIRSLARAVHCRSSRDESHPMGALREV